MHKVDRFMHIHADAVPGAMRQTGQLIARAKATTFVKAPDRIIHLARRCAECRRCLCHLQQNRTMYFQMPQYFLLHP